MSGRACGWILAGLVTCGAAGCSERAAPVVAPAAPVAPAAAPAAAGEFDADAKLREVRGSGAAPDDAWTAEARTLFARWQAGASPALLADSTLEPPECFRLGCLTRMVFPSRAAADAMTLDFFGSDANTGTRDTVFRSAPVELPGGARVAVTWGTLRRP